MRNVLLGGWFARSRLHHAILAIASLAILGGATAKAGFATLDSQSRFVLVTTEGTGFSGTPQTVQQTAPDFGPFNATVSSAQFAQPVQGVLQTAAQTSSISASSGGLTIVDSASDAAPNVTLSGLPNQSYFDVQFTLLTPATFTATYQSQAGSRFGMGPGPSSVFTGPGAPGTLSDDPLFFESPMQYSGELQPGSFEILANLQNFPGASNSIKLAVTITSIPLPPAVWPALAMLPLLVLVLHRSRSGANQGRTATFSTPSARSPKSL